jgi:hypothetical protein
VKESALSSFFAPFEAMLILLNDQNSSLSQSDTIAIVCPAGFSTLEKAATCIETLQKWGFKVKLGKTLGSQFHYFSGTDAERAADFQEHARRYFRQCHSLVAGLW